MAAFCSLIITLITTGTLIGITYAIYDRIAPLFSTYIKNHFGGSGDYDFSYIAHAARPQIMAICLAIGFVPVFAAIFGILYPIYRFFKKRDFPRTVNFLSVNSKKIKTSNNKLNRVGAIATTSITAIATAGFATTATGVMFTTSGSYNAFNDIMSYLSFSSAFGYSQDSMALHRMYDIVPLTKNAELMRIASIFFPNSKNIIKNEKIDKIIASPDFEKLKEIFYESELDAVMKTIVSPIASDKESIDFETLGQAIDQKQNL